jgi:hypothetical protein
MGSHPINLAVRLLLELSALAALGAWGWRQGEGLFGFVFALGIPIIAAVLWGIFAVPDDPSRSGKAPIATPGILRLALELIFFIFSAWAYYDIGYSSLGSILAILVAVHYVVSYDRVLWLIKQ